MEKEILSIIKKMKKFNLFGGNCGTFALALGKYIQKKYKQEPTFVLATSMDCDEHGNLPDEDYKFLDGGDYDLYHVMLGYVINDIMLLIDGSGIHNDWKYLENFCKEEYNDKYPAIAYLDKDDGNYSKLSRIIRSNTNWSISDKDFYNYIIKITNSKTK